MADTIDWPPHRRPERRGRLLLIALAAAILFGSGTAISYYVDALWFESLGYSAVFWKTLNLQMAVFAITAALTFVVLYGSFLALKPARLGEFVGSAILVNGQPLRLPVEPVLRLIALGIALVVAVIAGAGLMGEWPTLALYWYGSAATAALPAATPVAPAAGMAGADPIFGRPVAFYLFTLPAYQLIVGWLLTLAVIVCAMAAFFIVVTGGTRAIGSIVGARPHARADAPWRGLSIAFAVVLLLLAARVYLGRFDQLFQENAIFSGVTYTDAHVTLTGMLVVAAALELGAAVAIVNSVAAPRVRWLVAAVAPAAVCYVAVGLMASYVENFIVKPNQLVREQPFIAHNIAMTRQAYALNRVAQHAFPAEAGVEAVDLANNQATLQDIRLWDWRALQDTLRQIQEIRTYYDFPDIDIDRYQVDGAVRQMMLAVRELNIDKLPGSSRNWINEKLI